MNHALGLSIVMALIAPLGAQATTDPISFSTSFAVPLAGDTRIPVHSRVGEPGEPTYGIWAAGSAYKASFHGGMTFVPCLGRDYPDNQPVTWRSTSVRIGDRELVDAGRPPVMVHTDYRVEYRHGRVVEAYDVLPHGLEQTFVIAERPAGAGDLRVTGTVTTALWTPAVDQWVGDLVFRDGAGTPILRYGKAVAIDADGDSFQMTTTCLGNVVTLHLPAADVAAADFPLVVDPLLAPTNVTAVGTAADVGETDCASEGLNVSLNSVFCYTRYYSAADSDVVARISTVALTTSALAFADLSAATAADHARAAFVSATNSWVVVYQSLVLSNQEMRIRGAKFPGGVAPAASATSFELVAPAATHDWRPAVGGVADGGTGNYALVVFQRESGTSAFANTTTSSVMGVLFNTATSTGTWTAPFPIHGSSTVDAERPAVNRAAEGGAGFSWLVVGQIFTNATANDDWDLSARLVTNTGVVSGNAWGSSLGTVHQLGPVVDGRYGRYCIAFSTAASSTGKVQNILGTELRCERLDWAHGDSAPSLAGNLPAETLQTNSFRILEANGIAHNGASRSHWAIVWRSSSTSPALYATRVGYQGKPLQSAELVASTGANTPGAAAVLHHDSSGNSVVGYMTVGTTNSIWSRQWSLPTPVAAQNSGSGCGNGAGITWVGAAAPWAENQRIGCQLSGVRVHGAPANSLHLLFVATATANVLVVDPILASQCNLLVPIAGPEFLGNMPLAFGNDVTWQLPLPEALPGLTLHFQDWFLDPATGLFRGTSRLDVQLVK